MVQFSPRPSTEIASSSTMAQSNQNTFLWCKSQFETALKMFRLGCGDANTPQFGERMFETRTMQKIREIQSRVANEELVQLYFLAINRRNEGEESNPKVPAHKVGDILYEYFLG